MIIGIDYRLANSSNRGMARYCREIVASLIILDKKNKYILYFDSKLSDELRTIIERTDNFSVKVISTSNYILGEQLILPLFAWIDKLDVLWCPYNTFPLFLTKKCRLIVTIHDLIFLYLPDGMETIIQKIGRLYRKACVMLGRKRIDVCLSVSQYSAEQIKNIFDLDNVHITYNCISTFYNLLNNIKPSVLIRKNFYFTVSGDAPSKNLPFLLNLFTHIDCHLIIAGVKKESYIRKQYIHDNIKFLDEGISDSMLIHYYLTCKAFIFPSLQEGFGIPLLEAMVCDTPIIASDRTSIPEVLGEYGILFDPTSEESLQDAMIKSNKVLCLPDDKKMQHLEKFLNWDKTAILVKEIFLEC